MSIYFNIPEEAEFFTREFYPSNKDDNDEGVISYVKKYGCGRELVVTIKPFGNDSSVTAEIIENSLLLVSITRDDVTLVDFQGWGEEQIIRVYLKDYNNEFAIFYNPRPRVFNGDLMETQCR